MFQSLNWSETSLAGKEHRLPGISTVAKDRTFYIAPKNPLDDHIAPISQSVSSWVQSGSCDRVWL